MSKKLETLACCLIQGVFGNCPPYLHPQPQLFRCEIEYDLNCFPMKSAASKSACDI